MAESNELQKHSARVKVGLLAGLTIATVAIAVVFSIDKSQSTLEPNPNTATGNSVPEISPSSAQEEALAEAARVQNERLSTSATLGPDIPKTAALINSEGGRWGPVIQWPHIAASLANLPDGRVMSWSGSERTNWPTTEQTYSAVWDPRDNSFDEIFMRGHNMFSAATTMSADGRVFVNGGRNSGQSKWTSVFDWRENDWTQIENMSSGGRWYPGSVMLSDGDVYTTLGSSSRPWQGERWDKKSGWEVQFGVDWDNLTNRGGGERAWWPYLIQAPNGKILHAGPTPGFNWIDAGGDGSSTSAGEGDSRVYHKHSGFVVYDEGKALFSGGWRGLSDGASSNLAFTVDFNSATPVVAPTQSMSYARKYHNAVVLPTGEVAVFGGNTSGVKFSDAGSIYEVEIWNPVTGAWRVAAASSIPRNYHSTALLLTDGQVVSAGSGYDAGSANHQDGQVWAPPYLFNSDGSEAARPKILSAAELMVPGESYTMKTDGAISQFSMIKMSATTHGYNTDQRFLWVDAENTGAYNYRLSPSANVNVLTPGYWMLFALNDQGTPSSAHVVRVQNTDESTLVNVALEGEMSQSSQYQQLVPGLANDGDFNTISHTLNESQPWLMVDLGESTYIDSVKVLNRADCCSDRLNNFHVFVSDQPFASDDLNATMAQAGVLHKHFPGAPSAVTEFSVARTGRYVRVQLNGSNFLHLRELQVLGQSVSEVDLLDSVSIAQADESSWSTFHYNDLLLSSPVVIAGTLSSNDTAPATVRLRNVSAEGFDAQIDEWDYQDGTHARESLNLLTLQPGDVDMGGLDAEAGRQLVGNDWVRVNFSNALQSVPVILTSLNSATGAEAVVPRLRNIDTLGFEVRVQEEEANDAFHVRESVAWLAVTPGVGVWQGKQVRVGSGSVDSNWGTINYSATITDPQTFLSMQTFNDSDTAALRHRLPTSSGIGLRLEEEASGDSETSHSSETIGWLVIGQSTEVNIVDVSREPSASGSSANFTLSSTGGAAQYEWNFGDGTRLVSGATSVAHTYSNPGRYLVRVSVVGGAGQSQSFEQLVFAPLTDNAPTHSSTLVAADELLWNVNPDNNSVTAMNISGVQHRVPVGESPWALASTADGARLWVSNKDSASLSVINTATAAVIATHDLPVGSQPHGVVISPDGQFVYVALEATGELLKLRGSDGAIMARRAVGARPRHLSINADGQQLLVSRFITPPLPGEDGGSPSIGVEGAWNGGEVMFVNTADLAITNTVELRHSDRGRSENTGPGLPNYLGAAVISPSGGSAWVPSKQDNVLGGSLRGDAMTFDQTVRAVTSSINLESNEEDFERRIDHDNASVASYAAFDPKGLFLFTSLEGNRQVAVSDVNSGAELMRIEVGMAPHGLLVSEDSRTLYVHNFTERSISEIDISRITEQGELTASLLDTHTLIEDDALSAEILRGKQLFYDAADDRLAAMDYTSCASCHNDADHDGRVWDFTQLGEGVRNTTSLRGKGNPEHGLFHWTANFNEVQDFEGQIRSFAAGLGLMSNSDFAATEDPLALNKTGLSADLDALAAYVMSLRDVPTNPNGEVDADTGAIRGKALFASNCSSCHSGEFMTDSASGELHDVGTATTASGKRIGGTLSGFDTPSLLALWETAPYLHNGSAQTIAQAIQAHGLALNTAQVADLASYLLRIPASGGDDVEDGDITLIENNIVSSAVPQGEWRWYVFDSTAAHSSVSFALKGLSADADLYVRAGQRPSGHVGNGGIYDGSSTAGSTAGERVTLANNAATRWYVGVHGYQASPFTLEVTTVSDGGDTGGGVVDKGVLISGVPSVSSIALQQWHFFTVSSDGSHDKLVVEFSGLEADSDLYLRRGSRPSGHVQEGGTYDCSSTAGGSTAERCEVDINGEETWHIGVYGYQASPYTLLATLSADDDGGTGGGDGSGDNEVIDLISGEPQSGRTEQGLWRYYRLDAPVRANLVDFRLTGMTADSDLYVRAGSVPSGHLDNGGVYDCQSVRGGSSNEQCSLPNDGEESWYIGVYGYRATDFSLTAYYLEVPPVTDAELSNGVVSQSDVLQGGWDFYTFEATAAQGQVTFDLSGLSDDVDLYVRAGERPTGHLDNGGVYDCGSTRGGSSSESCLLSNSADTTWHVGVYGYRSSAYEIRALTSEGRSLTNAKGSKFKVEEPQKTYQQTTGTSNGKVTTGGGGSLAWLSLLLLAVFAAGRRVALPRVH